MDFVKSVVIVGVMLIIIMIIIQPVLGPSENDNTTPPESSPNQKPAIVYQEYLVICKQKGGEAVAQGINWEKPKCYKDGEELYLDNTLVGK